MKETPAASAEPSSPLIDVEVRYALGKELYFSAFEKQFSYGQWVLASLLAVHAGSLLAISQAGEATKALYQACGPFLIYGVGITLVAGGMAWLNYTVAMVVYANLVKSIRDGSDAPVGKISQALVKLTLWGTPIVAIASLVLFFLAANRATTILH